MKRTPSLSRLIELARDVRAKIEVYSQSEGGKKDLGGYCAIASLYLTRIARREHLYPNFVCGNFLRYSRIADEHMYESGHAWVELENTIVDITATQFSDVVSKSDRDFNRKVYVCANTNPHYVKLLTDDTAIDFAKTWHPQDIEYSCYQIDQL